jgi:hypothetical protein
MTPLSGKKSRQPCKFQPVPQVYPAPKAKPLEIVILTLGEAEGEGRLLLGSPKI